MTLHTADPATAEGPLTVTEMATKLRSGELTSVEVTSRMLEQADRLDGQLGSYLARFDERALAAAQQADDDLAKGIDRGPFQGVPVGIKDILAAKEGPTTAQSLVLDPAWGEGKDAPVVARLRGAGAVIMGKTTTMEFATGLPDPTKPFPLPRNPWNTDHWTGGSSSGTGNGIAAGFFLAGIGTDTGGSIRNPASFCGISGLKPTFGRVPKSGCTPLGYSLDHIGPMARSARDCAAMLSVIAGFDPSDECCASRPVEDYLGALTGSLEGVRIGVERVHHFPDGEIDPALRDTFDAAVAVLGDLGATLVDVELPCYDEIRTASMVTSRSEAMAYHLPDMQARWDDYFAATRIGVARGALVTGADYVQAQRVRRLAKGRLAELFQTVDLIASPTSATAATSYEELPARMASRAMRMSFTSYWNAVGQPALAIPMGFNAGRLPLSLQIAGRPFEEALVLRAGDAYQGATTWHLQVPPMAIAATAGA